MRIIDWKILKTMVPYCRQHIARLEQVGKFPKRVRLGTGPRSRCGWVLSEVETWIEARMTDRYILTLEPVDTALIEKRGELVFFDQKRIGPAE
jgi:prophage regulatory protein